MVENYITHVSLQKKKINQSESQQANLPKDYQGNLMGVDVAGNIHSHVSLHCSNNNK